jgi:hypothetical protein
MKSKQLRNIIREAILEVLDENVAVKVKGTTGKETVQSFSNITAANQLKSQNFINNQNINQLLIKNSVICNGFIENLIIIKNFKSIYI